MSKLKAYIICPVAGESRLYRWLDQLAMPFEIVDRDLPAWNVPDDAGILITHLHYRWEELAVLRKTLATRQVPVLILADGILEYRNTWQHPGLADGSLFQPLFGHKLACIGRAQARLVASWGNRGRCEVIGIPGLDSVAAVPFVRPTESNRLRLLVATATTPAFTQQQRQRVVASLRDVQQWNLQRATSNDRQIEIVWRLSDDLESDLGLPIDAPSDRAPLAEVLHQVDAAITTPSTLYLECVLRGRPTAVLDYHNQPQYVPSAWSISAREQLGPVITELFDPPAPKMQFQNFVLADQLESGSPATPRMLELVRRMTEIGRECRLTNQPLQFPEILVPLEPAADPLNPALNQWYPENAAFQLDDLNRLQVELSAAVLRLGQLPGELALKDKQVEELLLLNETLRQRVRELHARVNQLRHRLGIGKQD